MLLLIEIFFEDDWRILLVYIFLIVIWFIVRVLVLFDVMIFVEFKVLIVGSLWMIELCLVRVFVFIDKIIVIIVGSFFGIVVIVKVIEVINFLI